MIKGRGGFWALAVCLVVGFAFYEWLLYARWAVLPAWGALGSALGPIAAVFSAAAVFAALRSIELQRAALAGQQRELTKQQEQIERHMKLLEEQREQFTRSAQAHVDLANAQSRANTLAESAVEAHSAQLGLAKRSLRQARRSELAQRYTNFATFMAAAAQMRIALETTTGPASHPERMGRISSDRDALISNAAKEALEIGTLEKLLSESD